jgi:WD40 repeat protein
MRKALLGVALALWLAPPAHAANPTRVLYSSDWTGHPEIFAVDPTGKARVAQLTHWRSECRRTPWVPYVRVSLFPAPNGRYLAASCGRGLWLMRSDGRDARPLVPLGTGEPAGANWSRDSRLIAYSLEGTVHVFDTVTGGDRLADARDLVKVGWNERRAISPNGRWTAEFSRGLVTVVRAKNGSAATRPVTGFAATWSPDGDRLAVEGRDGIRVVDMHTRRVRKLTNDIGFVGSPPDYGTEAGLGFAWAPDGRSIAYVMGQERYGPSWSVASGDIRSVTMKGKTTTLVRGDRAYGGRISGLAWVKATPGNRYGPPDDTPQNRVAPTGLLANGPIQLLAADGKRVAFEACDTFVVWTPSTSSVEPAPPSSGLSTCSISELTGRYIYYDLALAGDRLVYALNIGCNSITLTLNLRLLTPPGGGGVIERSFGNCGNAFPAALGRLAGSGSLLVYEQWTEARTPQLPFPVTSATVHRVDGTNCPCPVIASTPGPLYPADVNDGRVVAYGDNETIVLDRDGNRLMSVPVSPQAAQLSGNHLILLTRVQLRDYDIHGAAPVHTWPVPDVPSGPVCAWRTCDTNRLVLNDAAQGLVAYTLDGQLHLLRLVDGADSVVGPGRLARFMDDGLVYADGSRLHLARFSALPLRGF